MQYHAWSGHIEFTFIEWYVIFLDAYHQISNIRWTEFQNLNVSRLILQLSLPQYIEPTC